MIRARAGQARSTSTVVANPHCTDRAKSETRHPVFSGRYVAEPGLSFSVSGNVGDHALLERDLLDLTRHLAQVDQYAVDLGHPHERVPIQPARQRPVWIKLTGAKRLRDGPGFATGGALVNPKEGADVRHGHVGLRRPIRQEVDLAQMVDDAAGPGARLSRDDRARSLSTQRSSHALRQLAGVRRPLSVP